MKKKLNKQTDISPLSPKTSVENRLEKPMKLNAVDNPESGEKKSKFTLADETAVNSESVERFITAFKQHFDMVNIQKRPEIIIEKRWLLSVKAKIFLQL